MDPKSGDIYFGDVGSSVWEVRGGACVVALGWFVRVMRGGSHRRWGLVGPASSLSLLSPRRPSTHHPTQEINRIPNPLAVGFQQPNFGWPCVEGINAVSDIYQVHFTHPLLFHTSIFPLHST